MDTISSLWDILNDINVNNISGVVVISFFIIILFAGCMEPFFASNIEIMLMNRNDILKRTSLSYAILFIVFAMLNYIIAIETFFLSACIWSFPWWVSCLVGGGNRRWRWHPFHPRWKWWSV